jgi:hypothetical protein
VKIAENSLSHFSHFFNRKYEKRSCHKAKKRKTPALADVFRSKRLQELLLSAHLGEALAAVDRTVGLGLERNLGLAAASCADCGEVLTGATSGVLASVAAGLAALGLVLEAALRVELLLTGSEHELFAALFAN